MSPQVPRALFLVLTSRGHSAALSCPQKLSGNPRPLPRLPPTFPTQSCLSPLLSPTPSIITAYFQRMLRSGAEPSPCSKQRHLLFLFFSFSPRHPIRGQDVSRPLLGATSDQACAGWRPLAKVHSRLWGALSAALILPGKPFIKIQENRGSTLQKPTRG